MAQIQIVDYEIGIQARLQTILGDTPVYKLFNRYLSEDSEFAVWQLRSVHQPVYTGTTQDNKGIDTPIVQVTLFDINQDRCVDNTQLVINALHGFNGFLNPDNTGPYVAKADVVWQYETYDNKVNLAQIVLDVQLYVST